MTREKSKLAEEELRKLKSSTQRLIDETSKLKSLLIHPIDKCSGKKEYDQASSMSCHLKDNNINE